MGSGSASRTLRPRPAQRAGGAAEEVEALAGELLELGRANGLEAVSIASAEPFDRARSELEERKARGLHAGMHFTFGNPSRSTDPRRALPGARALVVGARSYRRASAEEPSGFPAGSVARYSWSDSYAPLRASLEAIACRLEEDGWSARVLADDNALVDKEAAYQAGLGWYGKNTLLLLPGMGSWFVLGTVVTDAPLPASGRPVEDRCGSCSRCMAACPTGALIEPGVLDARRCLAWLLEAPGPFPVELREALGGRVYGCDDCQEVCPPNRAADRKDPPPPPEHDAEPWVDLVEMIVLEDDELLRRYERWYVPRREARYLRRNALVALGNTADGSDPGVVRALSLALGHADPLVRSHAVWAAGRIGLREVAERACSDEQDPDVRAELAALRDREPARARESARARARARARDGA